MTKFVHFDPTTGKILASGTCPGPIETQPRHNDVSQIMEGDGAAGTHQVVNGVIVALPVAEPTRETHATLRRREYPLIAEFADAYYWERNGDASKMVLYLAKCAAVKAKFPK